MTEVERQISHLNMLAHLADQEAQRQDDPAERDRLYRRSDRHDAAAARLRAGGSC